MLTGWLTNELVSAIKALAPTSLRLELKSDVISLGRSIERSFIYLREKRLSPHLGDDVSWAEDRPFSKGKRHH